MSEVVSSQSRFSPLDVAAEDDEQRSWRTYGIGRFRKSIVAGADLLVDSGLRTYGATAAENPARVGESSVFGYCCKLRNEGCGGMLATSNLVAVVGLWRCKF